MRKFKKNRQRKLLSLFADKKESKNLDIFQNEEDKPMEFEKSYEYHVKIFEKEV